MFLLKKPYQFDMTKLIEYVFDWSEKPKAAN